MQVEPITLSLIAIGVSAAFIGMIVWLIDSIGTLIAETNAAKERAIDAERRAQLLIEEQKRRLEEEELRQAERRRMQTKLDRLNYLTNKLNALESKYDFNGSIFKAIEAIIDGGITEIISSIAQLLELIGASSFLSENLKKPKNSIRAIQREIEQLESELEEIVRI